MPLPIWQNVPVESLRLQVNYVAVSKQAPQRSRSLGSCLIVDVCARHVGSPKFKRLGYLSPRQHRKTARICEDADGLCGLLEVCSLPRRLKRTIAWSRRLAKDWECLNRGTPLGQLVASMSYEPNTQGFPIMTSLHGPLRVGIGGPVGSGKTALMEALCKGPARSLHIAAITNDIYTKEDAEILMRSGALPPERIMGVETGGCPPYRIDESRRGCPKARAVSEARPCPDRIRRGQSRGGFSPELADVTIYVFSRRVDAQRGKPFP